MRGCAPSARARGRARLQRFTSSLSRALTTEAVYDVALGEGRELLGADAGLVALPVDDGAAVELVATLRLQRRGDRGLAPLPALAAHADRRGHRARPPDLPRRGPAGEPLPRRRAAAARRRPRCRCGSATTRSARSASASTRGHVFDDAEREFAVTHGRAVRLRARARTRATTPSGAGAERWACWRRSASSSRARSSRTRRCGRSPISSCRRSPTSASSTSWPVTTCAGSSSSTPIRRCTRPRSCSSATRPCSRATRRSPSRSAPACRRSSRRRSISRTRPTAARSTASPSRRVGIRTMLATPLLVRGRTLGALTFGWQLADAAGRGSAAARRADRAPRRARARQRRALPGGARRARAPGRARAPAAARRDHRRVLVAQAAVHEPARAGAARARRVGALDRGTARRARAPGARAGVDVRTTRSRSSAPTARAASSRSAPSPCATRAARSSRPSPRSSTSPSTASARRRSPSWREASVVLTETLDLQHTLSELVELAVPRLADWCTIDMLERGEIRNVGVAHSDPETARLARRLHARRPVRAQASSGVSAALSTGRSQLIPDVPAWLAEQETPDEELLTLVARARRALLDRRPARGSRARVRRPHAGDRRNPGGSSRNRIWRSPRISRAAPRSRSRTRASTAPSTTSRTRCSRACCPAR